MPSYRKKPVTIQAFVWDGDETNLFSWLTSIGLGNTQDVRVSGESAIINTLEGEMKASKGDFLIQGVKGELYPCKPDIFDATYERV